MKGRHFNLVVYSCISCLIRKIGERIFPLFTFCEFILFKRACGTGLEVVKKYRTKTSCSWVGSSANAACVIMFQALVVCQAEGGQSGNFNITLNLMRGLYKTSRKENIILVIRFLHWLPVCKIIYLSSAFGSSRAEWFGAKIHFWSEAPLWDKTCLFWSSIGEIRLKFDFLLLNNFSPLHLFDQFSKRIQIIQCWLFITRDIR